MEKKDKKGNAGKAEKPAESKPTTQEKIVQLKTELKNVQELIREYNVPEENLYIKTILEKMQERLEYYIKIIIQLLQPEEFYSLQECTVFDDSDKTKLFDMYKNMMILHREIIKSEIKNDEKDNIATINYAHSELKKLKSEMITIVDKMQDSWKRPGTNGKLRYFG
jgi:hypothetical protein